MHFNYLCRRCYTFIFFTSDPYWKVQHLNGRAHCQSVKILEIECVQKVALRIILNSEDYVKALKLTGLKTLELRRTDLCKRFAEQCVNNKKTFSMFPLNPSTVNTRNPENYFVEPATTVRLADSAIPYMQRLL